MMSAIFLARIRAFLARRQHELDLATELQQHLEREIERNLSRGLSPEEARRVAHIGMGNRTMQAEDGRRAVTGIWFEQVVQDIRYARRVLRRNPVFSLVTVLSLGFGIGAATTVFTTIDALDFRPLPFHEPDRLVYLAEVVPPTDDFCSGCPSRVSAPTAIDWFQQVQSYAAVGAVSETDVRWVHNDAIENLSAHEATPGFFRMLGIGLAHGRDFVPDDTLAGALPVVIVTHRFWLQRLAGDPDAVGRALPASLEAGTDPALRGAIVTGVLPRNFHFTATGNRQLWLPLRLSAASPRTARSLTVVGRLRDEVNIPPAAAELRAIFSRLGAAYPDAYRSWSVTVEPLRERLGWGVGGNRRLLFGITALVLLVAIVNVAGLFAARAAGRRAEFAMRSAFGANRGRLMRQLLIEGTAVGLGGGLIGSLVALWGVRFSSAWFGIDSGIATVDFRVLSFALLVSIAVGMITALGPASRISRADLIGDLRGRGASLTSWRTKSVGSALIVAQIACGLVLLSGAVLLSADYLRLRYADLGFNPTHLYATSISLPRAASAEPALWRDVAQEALQHVASIPGVRFATVEYRSALHPQIVRPLDGASVSTLTPLLTAVGPSYFETWNMPLIRGRSFGSGDDAGAPRVAIVNRSAAARFWPGQDPLGRLLFVGDSGAPGEILSVIGLTADAERGELSERHWPVVYRPLPQATLWHSAGILQIRVDDGVDRGPLLALAQAKVRQVLHRPANSFWSVEARLDERFQSRRLNAIAFTFFAMFGLALAAMGVYASMNAAVTRRTQEIGVRIALGADPRGTLRLVIRHGAVLSLVGVVLGLLGAGVMARVLRSLVADTDVLDVRLFSVAAALMVLTAGVAAWLPARRVLRIDPADSLRAE